MSKKILLMGIMFLSIGLVGCQSGVDGSSEAKEAAFSDDVKKVKKKNDSLRITYSEFKIDVPKNWEKTKVDNVDIFRIPGRDANISIKTIDNANISLDSCIEKVKLYAQEELKVTDIEENSLRVDNKELKTVMYNCVVNSNDLIYVNQAYMKLDDKIYVFTLVSNEDDDYEVDVDSFEKVIATIKC